jgi:hypothetical protein
MGTFFTPFLPIYKTHYKPLIMSIRKPLFRKNAQQINMGPLMKMETQ